MAVRETASYMLCRRNSARIAQCVTIGVVPPVVPISGTVIVRRVRGKMDTFVVLHASGKGVRQEKVTFAKEIEMTLARAQSLPVKYSVVKMIFVSSLEFPWLMLIDERFNCWSTPSGFSFPYVMVGAQTRNFQKQWLNEFTWLAYSNIYNGAFWKWCVVFTPQTVSRSAKPPGSLVSGLHCNYKKQMNIAVVTKTVTIINYVQPCSITLCRQMPTNPEMYERLLRAVDRRLSRKIEIVFPISSELLNFAVAKNTFEGLQRRWCIFTERNLLQWRSF